VFKHVILIGTAVGLGVVSGFAAQTALKVLANLSLIGGPGLFDVLLKAGERPDVFGIVGGATATGFAAIFYVVWGLIRLVGRYRGKDQRG
jgi:hypothetical protein